MDVAPMGDNATRKFGLINANLLLHPIETTSAKLVGASDSFSLQGTSKPFGLKQN